MDKSIKFSSFLLLLLSFLACSCQTKTKITITNKSNLQIDSIWVNDILRKNKKIIKPIDKNFFYEEMFIYEKSEIPRGETNVFGLIVFCKDFYFDRTAGFIGFPTAYIEDEYHFYITDDGITFSPDEKIIGSDRKLTNYEIFKYIKE